jgi:hypothetical protein
LTNAGSQMPWVSGDPDGSQLETRCGSSRDPRLGLARPRMCHGGDPRMGRHDPLGLGRDPHRFGG